MSAVRHLNIAGLRLAYAPHFAEHILEVGVGPEALTEWCAALKLLKDQLVGKTIFRQQALKLEMLLAPGNQESSEARYSPDSATLSLTPKDLDYLTHFFLKHLQQPGSKPDHLDLDIPPAPSGDYGTYVAFRVSPSSSP